MFRANSDPLDVFVGFLAFYSATIRGNLNVSSNCFHVGAAAAVIYVHFGHLHKQQSLSLTICRPSSLCAESICSERKLFKERMRLLRNISFSVAYCINKTKHTICNARKPVCRARVCVGALTAPLYFAPARSRYIYFSLSVQMHVHCREC